MDNNLNQELEEAKTEQSKNAVKEDAKGKQLKLFEDDFEISKYRYSRLYQN